MSSKGGLIWSSSLSRTFSPSYSLYVNQTRFYVLVMLTRHDNFGGEGDTTFAWRYRSGATADAVARYACVISEVTVMDVVDAQFGAIVEDAYATGDLHVTLLLEPDDLWRWRATSLERRINRLNYGLSILPY